MISLVLLVAVIATAVYLVTRNRGREAGPVPADGGSVTNLPGVRRAHPTRESRIPAFAEIGRAHV